MSSLSGARGRKRHKKEDAELDITSFMNLMIVLVPVLLMMMVFSRITVVELNLPSLSNIAATEDLELQLLEVEVSKRGLDVFFPQGYLVSNIPMIDAPADSDAEASDISAGDNDTKVHDYDQLQKTLISVKQTLLANGADKKDVILLLQEDTDYQTIVSLIDTTRSYEDVLVTSVVQAELFPQVSLSDAPKRAGGQP
ncbi:MAG: biopolymer transport protein ExbD [Alphaproteobacteria bacterium]|jgi:biopolymer transport protein ExbD